MPENPATPPTGTGSLTLPSVPLQVGNDIGVAASNTKNLYDALQSDERLRQYLPKDYATFDNAVRSRPEVRQTVYEALTSLPEYASQLPKTQAAFDKAFMGNMTPKPTGMGVMNEVIANAPAEAPPQAPFLERAGATIVNAAAPALDMMASGLNEFTLMVGQGLKEPGSRVGNTNVGITQDDEKQIREAGRKKILERRAGLNKRIEDVAKTYGQTANVPDSWRKIANVEDASLYALNALTSIGVSAVGTSLTKGAGNIAQAIQSNLQTQAKAIAEKQGISEQEVLKRGLTNDALAATTGVIIGSLDAISTKRIGVLAKAEGVPVETFVGKAVDAASKLTQKYGGKWIAESAVGKGVAWAANTTIGKAVRKVVEGAATEVPTEGTQQAIEIAQGAVAATPKVEGRLGGAYDAIMSAQNNIAAAYNAVTSEKGRREIEESMVQGGLGGGGAVVIGGAVNRVLAPKQQPTTAPSAPATPLPITAPAGRAFLPHSEGTKISINANVGGKNVKLDELGVVQNAEGKATERRYVDAAGNKYVSNEANVSPVRVDAFEDLTAQPTTLESGATTQEIIDDTEYKEFIDKGVVSPERLADLANKVKTKAPLSERENQIFADKTADINNILVQESQSATSSTPDPSQLDPEAPAPIAPEDVTSEDEKPLLPIEGEQVQSPILKDDNGTPITFYHGTNSDYDDEDIKTGQKMFGIHLTTDKSAAQDYGTNLKQFYVSATPKEVLDLSDGDELYEWMVKNEILDQDDLENSDLENYIKVGQIYQYDLSSRTNLADLVAKTAKSQGYKVVKMIDYLGVGKDNIAYVVTDTSALASTQTQPAPQQPASEPQVADPSQLDPEAPAPLAPDDETSEEEKPLMPVEGEQMQAVVATTVVDENATTASTEPNNAETNLVAQKPKKLGRLKIKPPSDNVASVATANGLTVSKKNAIVEIDRLQGGVDISQTSERNRVDEIKKAITSENGYISRIIIDGKNNVVEGQHRLTAMSELGYTEVPVVQLKGIDDYVNNTQKIKDLLQENGVARSDHRNQILERLSDIISKEGVDALSEYEAPSGFEKGWEAAIEAIKNQNSATPQQPASDPQVADPSELDPNAPAPLAPDETEVGDEAPLMPVEGEQGQAVMPTERSAPTTAEQGSRTYGLIEYQNQEGQVVGDKDQEYLPDGEKIKGQWKLVEAQTLTPSHDPYTFSVNPNAPTDEKGNSLNDRDYKNEPANQAAVLTYASNFKGLAVKSAPIVSKDGVVLGGNNRTMSRILAAEDGTDKDYISALQSELPRKGIDPSAIEGMKAPMLVFEEQEGLPYTTETYYRLNKDPQKGKSRAEKIVQTSRRIQPRAIRKLLPLFAKHESVAKLLSSPKDGKELVDILTKEGMVEANKATEYLTGGSLTPTGKERIKEILVGAIMTPEVAAIVTRDGGKGVGETISRTLPQLYVNALREDSIVDDINQAVVLASQAKIWGPSWKGKGNVVTAYIKNPSIEGLQTYSPAQVAFAMLLSKSGYKDFKTALDTFNSATKQDPLFGMGKDISVAAQEIIANFGDAKAIKDYQDYLALADQARTTRDTEPNGARGQTESASAQGQQELNAEALTNAYIEKDVLEFLIQGGDVSEETKAKYEDVQRKIGELEQPPATSVSDALQDVESTVKALEGLAINESSDLARLINKNTITIKSTKLDDVKKIFNQKGNPKKGDVVNIGPVKFEVNKITKGTVYDSDKKEFVDRDGYEIQLRDEKTGKTTTVYTDTNKPFKGAELSTRDKLGNYEQAIAEAYHKAKSDGSNPELVKAVQQALSIQQPTSPKPKKNKAFAATPTPTSLTYTDAINVLKRFSAKLAEVVPGFEIVSDAEQFYANLNEQGRQFMDDAGEVFGYTDGTKVYINPDIATGEIPFHEVAGHIFNSVLANGSPAVSRAWLAAVKASPVYSEIADNPTYQEAFADLSPAERDEAIAEEAAATFIGREFSARAEANKNAPWYQKLLTAFRNTWRRAFGGYPSVANMTPEDIRNFSMKDFAARLYNDVEAGVVALPTAVEEYAKEMGLTERQVDYLQGKVTPDNVVEGEAAREELLLKYMFGRAGATMRDAAKEVLNKAKETLASANKIQNNRKTGESLRQTSPETHEAEDNLHMASINAAAARERAMKGNNHYLNRLNWFQKQAAKAASWIKSSAYLPTNSREARVFAKVKNFIRRMEPIAKVAQRFSQQATDAIYGNLSHPDLVMLRNTIVIGDMLDMIDGGFYNDPVTGQFDALRLNFGFKSRQQLEGMYAYMNKYLVDNGIDGRLKMRKAIIDDLFARGQAVGMFSEYAKVGSRGWYHHQVIAHIGEDNFGRFMEGRKGATKIGSPELDWNTNTDMVDKAIFWAEETEIKSRLNSIAMLEDYMKETDAAQPQAVEKYKADLAAAEASGDEIAVIRLTQDPAAAIRENLDAFFAEKNYVPIRPDSYAVLSPKLSAMQAKDILRVVNQVLKGLNLSDAMRTENMELAAAKIDDKKKTDLKNALSREIYVPDRLAAELEVINSRAIGGYGDGQGVVNAYKGLVSFSKDVVLHSPLALPGYLAVNQISDEVKLLQAGADVFRGVHTKLPMAYKMVVGESGRDLVRGVQERAGIADTDLQTRKYYDMVTDAMEEGLFDAGQSAMEGQMISPKEVTKYLTLEERAFIATGTHNDAMTAMEKLSFRAWEAARKAPKLTFQVLRTLGGTLVAGRAMAMQRENAQRMATFIYFQEQLEKWIQDGCFPSKLPVGLSNYNQVLGLITGGKALPTSRDPKERTEQFLTEIQAVPIKQVAGKIAREMYVDYGNSGRLVQASSSAGVTPFARYPENSLRYTRDNLWTNVYEQGMAYAEDKGLTTKAGKTAAITYVAAKKYAFYFAAATIIAGLNYGLNRPEDEELQDIGTAKPGLVLGRDELSRVLLMRTGEPALENMQLLGVMGLYQASKDLPVDNDVWDNAIEIGERMAADRINTLWNLTGAIPKMTIELGANMKFYGSFMRANRGLYQSGSPIDDKGQYLAEQFRLRPLYDYLTDKPRQIPDSPMEGALDLLKGSVVKEIDTERQAYYIVKDVLARSGWGKGVVNIGESTALTHINGQYILSNEAGAKKDLLSDYKTWRKYATENDSPENRRAQASLDSFLDQGSRLFKGKDKIVKRANMLKDQYESIKLSHPLGTLNGVDVGNKSGAFIVPGKIYTEATLARLDNPLLSDAEILAGKGKMGDYGRGYYGTEKADYSDLAILAPYIERGTGVSKESLFKVVQDLQPRGMNLLKLAIKHWNKGSAAERALVESAYKKEEAAFQKLETASTP